MLKTLVLTAFTITTLMIGCAGGRVKGSVYASSGMVEVSPGVYAMVETDDPIYYTGNSYWRYDGGSWYRSPYLDRGWVYAAPPTAIRRLDRPDAYRYRADGTRVQRSIRRDAHGRQVIREPSRRDYPPRVIRRER